MFTTLNAMKSISVAAFIPDLVSLLLLFCLASSALPDELGERTDLAHYYEENRKRLWSLFALYTIWVTVVLGVRVGLADAPLGRLLSNVVPNLLLAALMLVLVATPRRWVHLLVVTILLLTTALAWLPQELGRAG
jgi:hypothetical protein